jgi:hypothetical protein
MKTVNGLDSLKKKNQESENDPKNTTEDSLIREDISDYEETQLNLLI